MAYRTNLLSKTPRVRDIMVGVVSSAEGVLVKFPRPILTKIRGEPTREVLINLHELVRVNAASVASNLGGGRHKHIRLEMTSAE